MFLYLYNNKFGNGKRKKISLPFHYSIMSSDTIANVILTAASASGLAGLFWGIYQYRETKAIKRKEILFDLIKEFDDPSNKMQYAKLILDRYYITPKRMWQRKDDQEYYSITNLNRILRKTSNKDPITDPGETEIRHSFDTLLDFFDKLAYLLSIGIIKQDETLYFDYYIIRAIKQKEVRDYAKTYEFPLFRNLILILAEKSKTKIENIRIYELIYFNIRNFVKDHIN
jgi:hypothetical protein